MSARRFSDDVTKAIVARIEHGVSFKDAAIAEQVKPETARSWLTKGRRESTGAYAEFAAAVEEARAKAEAAATKPMTDDEFNEHLASAVRNGSVQAMKLYDEIRQRDKGNQPTGGGGDEFEL